MDREEKFPVQVTEVGFVDLGQDPKHGLVIIPRELVLAALRLHGCAGQLGNDLVAAGKIDVMDKVGRQSPLDRIECEFEPFNLSLRVGEPRVRVYLHVALFVLSDPPRTVVPQDLIAPRRGEAPFVILALLVRKQLGMAVDLVKKNRFARN